MNKNILLSLSLISALALGACSSSGKKNANDAQSVGGGSASSAYNDSIAGGTQIGSAAEDARNAAERSLTTNVIYFDYDSASISSQYTSVVSAYARYLVANQTAKVRLEGHSDERGTREYNVGLGERRANAVRDALAAEGVSAAQVSVLSYGEERPAAEGHDEAAWAQNRRVQIIRQ